MGKIVERLPWRQAAAAVDANPHTQGLWDPPQVEKRLTLLELETEIITCTNRMVTLQAELAKVGNRRAELQMEVAKKAIDLGVSETMMRAAGRPSE